MTDQINPQQEHILEEGFEEVTSLGVRAFTVESLASRLAMSKKTIYKFFPTKEDLLDKILEFATDRIVNEIERIRLEEPNPARRFLLMMDFIVKMAGKVSPQRLSELKGRYPLLWKKLEQFRLERRADFYEFLSDAQKAGYVRVDMDIDAVATLYIHIVNSTFQPEFFVQNDMSVSKTIRLFVDIITQGLFTEKGLKSVGTE